MPKGSGRCRGFYGNSELTNGVVFSVFLWSCFGYDLVHRARQGAAPGASTAALALGVVGAVSSALLGALLGLGMGRPFAGPLLAHAAGLFVGFLLAPGMLPKELLHDRPAQALAVLAGYTAVGVVASVVLVARASWQNSASARRGPAATPQPPSAGTATGPRAGPAGGWEKS